METRSIKRHPGHYLASQFPMYSYEELVELSESIKEEGLLVPITLYEDAILDGRNREEAILAMTLWGTLLA
jgi:ParB-like chromosome segregation protein Spo0J